MAPRLATCGDSSQSAGKDFHCRISIKGSDGLRRGTVDPSQDRREEKPAISLRHRLFIGASTPQVEALDAVVSLNEKEGRRIVSPRSRELTVLGRMKDGEPAPAARRRSGAGHAWT